MADSGSPGFPGVEVTPVHRDIKFDLSGVDMGNWHPHGRHVTHFFNAMSITFPEGERFFIESVRNFRDRITDPKLQADVRTFIGQEAMHGREHRVYNDALRSAGYPVDKLEAVVLRECNLGRKLLPKRGQLAVTIALEHFTAILAHALLHDDNDMRGVHPEMEALWRWHAVEETEHKAVAFDVYRTVSTGSVSGWLRRCLIMVDTSFRFWWRIFWTLWALLKTDGIQWQGRGWRQLLGFLFVHPAPLVKAFFPYWHYFKPSFHPWMHDTRDDLERWRPGLEERLAPPAALADAAATG